MAALGTAGTVTRTWATMAVTWSSVAGGPPRWSPSASAPCTYFATVFRSRPVARAIARRPSPSVHWRNTSRTSIMDSSR